ncbi:MAG: DUF4838 domain-containing protein [Ruminococcaceae bacterium]|nr:DUF4838 domain-containing protein [Oscillospiraceae bacterium]
MKKLLSVILLASMLLSVAACSNNKKSGAGETTGTQAVTGEETTDTVTDDGEDTTDTDDNGYRIKKLTIGGKDISEYTIYLADDANENIKFAAEELARLVEAATGVKVPVKTGNAEGTAIEFAVSDDASLKDDGYVYTVSDGYLKFEGAADRGASNGVWRFLENECGWDYLIYGDSYLNESEHVDIPAGTTASETPVCAYFSMWDGHGLDFINDRGTPTAEQINYGAMSHAGHGMQSYNFAELDNFVNQPCYTDEDTYQIIKKNVEAHIQGRLDAGEKIGVDFKDVSIGQVDTRNFCRCNECNKLSRTEGSNSGPVVKFANRLSEELNEKYPGLMYKIYAYQGTNKAPANIVPNEYVHISFAYDRACSNHLIDGSECEMNAKYNEWITSWANVTDNLYVRDYALGSLFNQYTVIDNLYDDFRYLASLGVTGLCREVSDEYDLGFHQIEKMLLAQLNWNVDMTREEFTEIYHDMLKKKYGDGWEKILEYIDILTEAQDKAGCWDCWGGHVPEYQRFDVYYYRDNFDHILELLDEAKALAKGEDELRNIELLYPAVLYTGCQASYFLEFLEGDEERMAVLETKYEEFVSRFEALGYRFDGLKNQYGEEVFIRKDLYREAWGNWDDNFETWTGQKLPEKKPAKK